VCVMSRNLINDEGKRLTPIMVLGDPESGSGKREGGKSIYSLLTMSQVAAKGKGNISPILDIDAHFGTDEHQPFVRAQVQVKG
jgi:hypothetical protein